MRACRSCRHQQRRRHRRFHHREPPGRARGPKRGPPASQWADSSSSSFFVCCLNQRNPKGCNFDVFLVRAVFSSDCYRSPWITAAVVRFSALTFPKAPEVVFPRCIVREIRCVCLCVCCLCVVVVLLHGIHECHQNQHQRRRRGQTTPWSLPWSPPPPWSEY